MSMAVGVPSGIKVSYARQYRRCGKANCASCREGGHGHGPYWYAYWDEGGRRCSRYLGKQDPRPLPEIQGRLGVASHAQEGPTITALRVRALGAFQIWRDGEQIPATAWRRHKAATLLKYLLSADGHRL